MRATGGGMLTEGLLSSPGHDCQDSRENQRVLARLIGGNLIFPFISVQHQTASTTNISKKENTKLPPKTIEWYVHALLGVIPTLVTAIAQGSTQHKLLTKL